MVTQKKSQAHEHSHAARHELDFRVAARRNRLLGQWAAEKMGLAGDAVDAFAKEVVLSDLEEPGEEDVVRKVMGAFTEAGVEVAEDELRQKMADLLDQASAQVEAEAD